MAQVGVGAVEHPEVGERGHDGTVQGGGAGGPDVRQAASACAGDFDGVHEFYCTEASREDEDVVLVGCAVGELDAVLGDACDFGGFEGGFGGGEGWVVVVADDNSFAAWVVVWGQFLPELVVSAAVGDLGLHGVDARCADQGGEVGFSVCHCGVE